MKTLPSTPPPIPRTAIPYIIAATVTSLAYTVYRLHGDYYDEVSGPLDRYPVRRHMEKERRLEPVHPANLAKSAIFSSGEQRPIRPKPWSVLEELGYGPAYNTDE